MRLLVSFVIVFGFIAGMGQQGQPQTQLTYSESAPYTPQAVPDKKRKSDQKVLAGDQTNVNVSETLSVPLAVLDKDRHSVKDLNAADVKVYVDGNEVAIERLERVTQPINIVFLLDASPSSFAGEKSKADAAIAVMKTLAIRLVSKLAPDDKVMIASFAQDLKVHTEFTSDREIINKALKKVDMRDGTALYNAVTDMLEKRLTGSPFPTAILLMTDGADTVSRRTSYESSLRAAERSTIPIFPIYFDTFAASQKIPSPIFLGLFGATSLVPGMSKGEYELGKNYLIDLTTLSGGYSVRVDSILPGNAAIFDNLPDVIRSEYRVTIKLPPAGGKSDRRNIKIRVNRPDLRVLTKASYVAP